MKVVFRQGFSKTFAKLSRKKKNNSLYKMIHIYIINTEYKFLQCNLDMYMNFRQNFSQKKKFFRHFRKKL